jgi:hypothetical protein
MRVVSSLSGLVAALLAAAAPSAVKPSAPILRITPPAHIFVLRVPVAATDRRTRTCNARGSQRQSSRVERQLAPVACEQPPRSKVILTLDGGLFGSGR